MELGTIRGARQPARPDPPTRQPANAPALDGDYLAYEDDQGSR
jgi:hypothetical protein